MSNQHQEQTNIYSSSIEKKLPPDATNTSHLGGHPEFLKTFKKLNLLYNKYVIQISLVVECTEKKNFYSRSSAQPKMAF